MSKTNGRAVKRQPVKVELKDGKMYELCITLNSMVELEEIYGTVEEAFQTLQKGKLKDVRCILWAALLDSCEGITEKEVGALIDVNNLESLVEALGKVADSDLPEEEEVSPN